MNGIKEFNFNGKFQGIATSATESINILFIIKKPKKNTFTWIIAKALIVICKLFWFDAEMHC